MATYVIFTSDANLVEAFDDEEEARAELEQIREQDPENADEYEIIAYDDADDGVVGGIASGPSVGAHA